MAEDYDQATTGKFLTGLAGITGLSNDKLDVTGNTPFEITFQAKARYK